MAQETIPVQGLGTSAAPLAYPVAVGDSFDLMAAFASFDGSGAAAAWVPALQVLAPSGAVMVSTIGSSVAAGGSADVTFAPFLEAPVTGSTPVTSSGLAWAANLSGSVNFANTGFNVTAVSLNAGNFVTNDATVFEEHTSGGISGIRALTAGVYFVWTSVIGQSNAAPAAGSFIKCRTLSAVGQEFDASNLGGWFQTDAAPLYEANATYGWEALVSPGPTQFSASVGQNSGGTILLQLFMQIVRISSTLP